MLKIHTYLFLSVPVMATTCRNSSLERYISIVGTSNHQTRTKLLHYSLQLVIKSDADKNNLTILLFARNDHKNITTGCHSSLSFDIHDV